MAQGAEPKPLELSRYCVPFTPFQGKLEDVSICIVSTAAVRHKDDKPFDTEGDITWRVIGTDAEAKDLRYDDSHYDHACVDRDLNCVFPIDRVRELAHERRVSGLTERHFSLGYSQALRELREKTIPALVREVDRERPGAVLLTGG
jgi:D-proline reductase (dithiol) PrdB